MEQLVRLVGVVTRMSGKEQVPRFFYEEDYGHTFGRHIHEVVAQKGIKVPWIAQQLGCHRNNVYLIFSRQWIDTVTLMKLSIILQYDFFAELSEWYRDAGFTLMELSSTTPYSKK